MEFITRMRPRLFECVELKSTADTMPMLSSQTAPRTANAIHLGLMSLLAAVIVLPQVAFVAYAISSPQLRSVIAGQPLIALQLVIALIVWISLFAIPLSGLIGRLTWRRNLEITADKVAVQDDGAFGASHWTAPLASYKGVAHHIRSSLSGNRHELVLVHPDPRHSVLLLVAENISDSDVARMSNLLRMPQIPARELYRVRNNPQAITLTTPETADWSAAPA